VLHDLQIKEPQAITAKAAAPHRMSRTNVRRSIILLGRKFAFFSSAMALTSRPT
jgi:hypothetical protein